MAIQILTIPVAPSLGSQVFTTTLDGRRFELRLDWIQRVRRWALSLSTDSGTPLLRCKFAAVRSDLLRQIRWNPNAPQGYLTVVDSEAQDTEAGFASLGARHALIYVSQVPDPVAS